MIVSYNVKVSNKCVYLKKHIELTGRPNVAYSLSSSKFWIRSELRIFAE